MRRLGSELRQRKHLKVIQELDAFPKVPESYQKTTASGGTVSILTFLFIGILIISEFQYYRATDIQYNYEVDTDSDSKLQINVDLTIAMKCQDNRNQTSSFTFNDLWLRPRNRSGRYTGHYDRWITKFTVMFKFRREWYSVILKCQTWQAYSINANLIHHAGITLRNRMFALRAASPYEIFYERLSDFEFIFPCNISWHFLDRAMNSMVVRVRYKQCEGNFYEQVCVNCTFLASATIHARHFDLYSMFFVALAARFLLQRHEEEDE
ncbi:endoplasmic reticulum-Golgi intermediate compartment 2-like, partial [Paramuricea clavata]